MDPISESLQEIDENHWRIANMLFSRQSSSPSPELTSWSDGKGGFFVISEASPPFLPSKQLSETSAIQKVYEAGTTAAVWQAGEAFIKAHKLQPRETPEHVTLDFLHAKSSLNFDIPIVHHHTEHAGRYYLITSRLAGKTLNEMWASVDQKTQDDYARRIATICDELTLWTGEEISGVDGNQLGELYLTKKQDGPNGRCEPRILLRHCQELGMDCSSLVFYHCDLGPGNIIINPQNGAIGIIDWENAGYVPKTWIRTKFRLSSGMDLDLDGGSISEQQEWRRRVALRLGDMGYQEVAESYSSWSSSFSQSIKMAPRGEGISGTHPTA